MEIEIKVHFADEIERSKSDVLELLKLRATLPTKIEAAGVTYDRIVHLVLRDAGLDPAKYSSVEVRREEGKAPVLVLTEVPHADAH